MSDVIGKEPEDKRNIMNGIRELDVKIDNVTTSLAVTLSVITENGVQLKEFTEPADLVDNIYALGDKLDRLAALVMDIQDILHS